MEGYAGATRSCTAAGPADQNNNANVEAEDEKSRGGTESTPKDVKNEGRSGNVYENKGQVTLFPTQKTTFVPGCTPFYTKMQVFCGNRRLFCHFFEPWEPNRLLRNVETRGHGHLGPWHVHGREARPTFGEVSGEVACLAISKTDIQSMGAPLGPHSCILSPSLPNRLRQAVGGIATFSIKRRWRGVH